MECFGGCLKKTDIYVCQSSSKYPFNKGSYMLYDVVEREWSGANDENTRTTVVTHDSIMMAWTIAVAHGLFGKESHIRNNCTWSGRFISNK